MEAFTTKVWCAVRWAPADRSPNDCTFDDPIGAAWGASDLRSRGKRVGLSQLVIRPLWRFVKCYLLQGAWREGRRGFVLGVVHAWSAFAKYAVLWDLERQAAEEMTARVPTAPARGVTPRAWPALESASKDGSISAEPITGVA